MRHNITLGDIWLICPSNGWYGAGKSGAKRKLTRTCRSSDAPPGGIHAQGRESWKYWREGKGAGSAVHSGAEVRSLQEITERLEAPSVPAVKSEEGPQVAFGSLQCICS